MATDVKPIALQYYKPGSTEDPKYYDAKTGDEVPYSDIGYYQVSDIKDAANGKLDVPKKVQEAAKQVTEFKGNGGDKAPQAKSSSAGPRSVSNNFGFAPKPGLLSLAAAIAPGPAGLVAKAGSLAFNANNRQATQDARSVLGLKDKMNLGGFVSDNKGQVANLNINDKETVPVGFEASDPTGRTNLTVNEARNRMLTTPNITEATPQDVKDAKNNFKQEGLTAPKTESIASKMFGNMFAKDEDTSSTKTASPEHHVAYGLGLAPSVGATTDSSTSNAASKGSEGTINSFDKSQLSPSAQHMVDTMSKMGYGDVGVNSDKRSVADNAAVGGAKASQHLQGNAVDISTASLTDAQKEGTLDAALSGGANGIGAYTSGNMHIDTRTGATTMWGRDNSYSGIGVSAMPGWAQNDLQAKVDANGFSYLSNHQVPTPIARPTEDTAIASADTQTATHDYAPNLGNPVGFAATPSAQPSTRTVALSEPTGKTAQQRLSELSPEDKRMMAMTLAGEIDPTKTDLSTPEGVQEAYGIAQTMDNRVSKYGTMQGVISAPKQYSTWNNTAAANTAVKNYQTDPAKYDNLVSGYYSDDANNQGFTSYHNTAVNPGWSAQMSNPTQIGPHIFGTLPEYSPAKTTEVSVGKDPTPTGYYSVQDTPAPTQAVSVNPSLSAVQAAAAPQGFAAPSEASTSAQTSDAQGDSSKGQSSQSQGPSGSQDSGMGGTSHGSDSSSSMGSASTDSGIGGGFASSPSSNSSDSDSDGGSTNDGKSGYSGSRSDGWN